MNDESPIQNPEQHGIKPKTKDTGAGDEKGNNETPTTGAPSILPNVNPSQNNSNQPDKKQKKPFPWKVLAEGIALVVGIALLLINTGQLYEAHQTRLTDERAWVGAVEVLIVPEGDTRYIQVKFKNTGKTPAINVIPTIGGYLSPKDVPPIDKVPIPATHVGLLQPSAEGFTTSKDHPISKEGAFAIQNGADYFVAGTIWYDDIFGQTHWSQFCYHFKPDLTTEYPAFHNSSSEAKTNQTN